MLKYCVDKWEANKEVLREALTKRMAGDDRFLGSYGELVSMIIRHILNHNAAADEPVWNEKPHIIDDGDYQGTLLFLIARDCYEPSCCDYLLTCVHYGSCSYCDAFEAARFSDNRVSDLMTLALHIIQNTRHPYESYCYAMLDENI